MRLQLYRINKIVFFASILSCICLFTFLFYSMATANIDTDQPEFWMEPYYSDLPFHIKTASESYSFMGILMNIIYTLFSYNVASLLFSLLLAAMEVLTVYLTYLLLLELDKVSGIKTKAKNRIFYQWFSLATIFIVSYYLPPLLPSFYYYALNMTCWQNDTYIGMRLFSLLALIFFIRLYNNKDNFQKKDLIFFSLSLLLSTWMKPNFFIGFVILLFTVAIWRLIVDNDKKVVFKRWSTIAICIVPSVVCVLLQNALVYGSNTGDSIIFAPFLVIDMHIINWQLAIVVLLLFPVIVFLLENKSPNNNKTIGYAIFFFLFIEYVFGLLFAESGSRTFDFNFWWGMTITNSLIFIWAIHTWYNGMKNHINEKTPMNKYSGAYLCAGILLLIYLTCTGMVFFVLITSGEASFIC